MRKWTVRLMGVLFLLTAIQDILAMTIYRNGWTPISFVKVNILGQDIGGWIMVCIMVPIGYNLVRLKDGGRFGALVIFWLTLIGAVVVALWGGFYAIQFPDQVSAGSVTLSFAGMGYSTHNLFIVWGFFVLLITIYVLAIVFLSSKKTRALFGGGAETGLPEPDSSAPANPAKEVGTGQGEDE